MSLSGQDNARYPFPEMSPARSPWRDYNGRLQRVFDEAKEENSSASFADTVDWLEEIMRQLQLQTDEMPTGPAAIEQHVRKVRKRGGKPSAKASNMANQARRVRRASEALSKISIL